MHGWFHRLNINKHKCYSRFDRFSLLPQFVTVSINQRRTLHTHLKNTYVYNIQISQKVDFSVNWTRKKCSELSWKFLITLI